MAISTYGVKLMYKAASGSTYTELVEIKDFPDLGGGAPEMLETTTLSSSMQTYIPGIKSSDALEFTANYTKTDYDKIDALITEQSFAVYFGKDGADGKFYFKGTPSVRVNGAGVNEVVNMTISIAPSTAITTKEA